MLDEGPGRSTEALVARAKRCLNSFELSDFSSKARMQHSGWLFGWSGSDTFKPTKELYASYVSEESYWGFSQSVDAEVALVLKGQGILTLDFGNSFGGSRSQVVVFLNGQAKSRAGANTLSKIVRIPFKEGDVLRLAEANGIIVINSIIFNCASPVPAGAPTVPVESLESAPTSGAPTAAVAESWGGAPAVEDVEATFQSTATAAPTTTLAATTTTLEPTTTTTRTATTITLEPTTTTTTLEPTSSKHTSSTSSTADKEDGDETERRRGAHEPERTKGNGEHEAQETAQNGKHEDFATDQLERLKHKTAEQVESESQMSERLAKTAKQLERLEKEEREELRKAEAEKQKQEELEAQLSKLSKGVLDRPAEEDASSEEG